MIGKEAGRRQPGCLARGFAPTGSAGSVVAAGLAIALAVAIVVAVATSMPASANWLTRILGEAGEAGGEAGLRAGRTSAGILEQSARGLGKLPQRPGEVPLLAHATQEGHWKFANADGDVFTAANQQEMARVLPSLAPEAAAAGDVRLALHLTPATVFDHAGRLSELPPGARLALWYDGAALPLSSRAAGGTAGWWAQLRPNVIVGLTDAKTFGEILWRLERPLGAADVRVVALKPGSGLSLTVTPRIEAKTGRAQVDEVDPEHIVSALAGARGQTVVMTGRVVGDMLEVAAGGSQRAMRLADLRKAAADADVNLVVLRSDVPQQPGGRNWLWQTIEVDGMGAALKQATFADFLDALGASRGQLAVTARMAPETGRLDIAAVPAGPRSDIGTIIGDFLGEIVSNVTGNVVISGIEVSANEKARQKEIDARILPWLPSEVHILYLAALAAGVIGLSAARAWFARLWPREERAEYASAFGYQAARATKLVLFVAVFLPLVGPFALVWSIVQQVLGLITLPVRMWRRVRGTA